MSVTGADIASGKVDLSRLAERYGGWLGAQGPDPRDQPDFDTDPPVTEPMTRPEAMDFCVQHYGRWSAPRIQAHLAERGISASCRTIRRWADRSDEQAKADNQRRVQRRREQRAWRRIVTLRERGLPYTAIAIVMSVDIGTEIGPEHVRYAHRNGHLGREIRKALKP